MPELIFYSVSADLQGTQKRLALEGYLAKNLDFTHNQMVLSVIAFHEKAGWSQVDSEFFFRDKVFSPAEWPLSPCFHPHSRGAIGSLGARWAFSFQPVLPSDLRPVALLF